MGKTSQRDDILNAVIGIIGLSQRKILAERIINKIDDFVDTYEK
ncbi:hypothetical protein [Bernardetia sp. MNP-M8]